MRSGISHSSLILKEELESYHTQLELCAHQEPQSAAAVASSGTALAQLHDIVACRRRVLLHHVHSSGIITLCMAAIRRPLSTTAASSWSTRSGAIDPWPLDHADHASVMPLLEKKSGWPGQNWLLTRTHATQVCPTTASGSSATKWPVLCGFFLMQSGQYTKHTDTAVVRQQYERHNRLCKAV